MIISTEAMASNSEMIKNYKGCREKAEKSGKLFILKNNQLDAVLFSVSEYEMLSNFFEYLGSLDETELAKIIDFLPKAVNGKSKIFDPLGVETNK